MYSMVMLATVATVTQCPCPPSCRMHYPNPCCTGFRGVDPCYDGGWWYGATAWDGCPPQYVSPPWACAPSCCGCGGDGPPLHYAPAPTPTTTTPSNTTPSNEPATPPAKQGLEGGNRAQLILDVPEGARVFVDGHPFDAGPGRQVLPTPVLQRGQVYYYEIEMEMVRDGKAQRENRQVVVRAGDSLQVTFSGSGPDLPAEATASR